MENSIGSLTSVAIEILILSWMCVLENSLNFLKYTSFPPTKKKTSLSHCEMCFRLSSPVWTWSMATRPPRRREENPWRNFPRNLRSASTIKNLHAAKILPTILQVSTEIKYYQGSLGIRQSTRNWILFPIIINKSKPFADLIPWLKSFVTTSLEPPNKNSMKVPKANEYYSNAGFKRDIIQYIYLMEEIWLSPPLHFLLTLYCKKVLTRVIFKWGFFY